MTEESMQGGVRRANRRAPAGSTRRGARGGADIAASAVAVPRGLERGPLEPALNGAMDRLAARVRAELAGEPFDPHALALLTGGKRLRAALVFAAADGEAARPAIVAAAAAIELVHAGSLLHDDVVDRCERRRGTPTQHVARGLPSAVWSGAAAVHVALRLARELPGELRTRLADVACEVAAGQLEEIGRAFASDLTPAARLRIMERKTASVFGLAAELGSSLAGDPREGTELLRRAGRALGVLFQIADDLDDVFGSEEELGRRPGADLREGVVSLPLAFALQIGVPADWLREAMGEAARSARGRRALLALLETSGAIGATRRVVLARARIVKQAVAWRRLATRRRGELAAPGAWGADWLGRLGEATLRRITRSLGVDGAEAA